MIEAGLEFDGDVEPVLAVFAGLPPELRPAHFSHEERINKDADRIDNQKRFADFISKGKSGFFLLGPAVTYSFRIASGRPLVCDCFLDVSPELVELFLEQMSKAHPIFGFACSSGERERRNRITVQQGLNTVESWVGRDTRKYIPGFYWLTLLPEALAKQHGIPLSAVESAAKKHIALEGEQHLFRFYERPDDWQEASNVDELCKSLPSVFAVEKVKSQLSTANSFLELNSLLREWK